MCGRGDLWKSPYSERRRNSGGFYSKSLRTGRRDRIVIGIREKSLSQRLQKRSDLNLDVVIQMARQSELVKSQVGGQSDTQHLGEIHRKKGKPNFGRRPVQNLREKKPKNAQSIQPRSRCNRIHKKDKNFPGQREEMFQMP